MDLEKLYQQQKYLEIINDYKDSKNPKEVYYVIVSFFALNRLNEALDLLLINKDIMMRDNPKRTFTLHLNLLKDLGEFDEAIKSIEEYKSLPYISYEMEELYKEFEETFKKLKYEKKSKKEDENLHALLLSPSFNDQLFAISSLYDGDISPYINEFKLLLNDLKTSPIIQSFILMLLLAKKDSHEYKINKLDMTYDIIPYELEPIMSKEMIRNITYDVLKDDDINFLNSVEFILMRYALIIYPEPLALFEDESIVYASGLLAKEILGQEKEQIYEKITEKLLNVNTIDQLKEMLSKIIDENLSDDESSQN